MSNNVDMNTLQNKIQTFNRSRLPPGFLYEMVGWGVPRAPFFLIERKVLDKYEVEARKNKGKIQEKVSPMKNQGGT